VRRRNSSTGKPPTPQPPIAIVRMTEQPPIASWHVATRQGERDEVVRSFAVQLGQRAKEVFDVAQRR